MHLRPITLATALQWLGNGKRQVKRSSGAVVSDPELAEITIETIASLEHGRSGALSFLSNTKYRKLLNGSAVGVVLLRTVDVPCLPPKAVGVVSADPYLDYARLVQRWTEHSTKKAAASIHSTALLAHFISPELGVSIGAGAIVSEGVELGQGAVIGALCFIGKGVKIGAGTQLYPRVTVLDDCEIGARCIVHSGAVIGSDGFGFAPTPEKTWEKIPQLGRVVIGDDCEIGANTTIDRGALGDTVLEEGVKLDNQVQIAHGVRVGRHTAIAGCAGVAGSAVIGAHCTVGGGAVVLGHLRLCEGVHVSAATVVTRSISKPGEYTGFFPFDDNVSWEKNAAALKQLAQLRDRIKQLESKP